jgi:hypothetical protein
MIRFQPSELPRTLVGRPFLLSLAFLAATIVFTYAWLTRPQYGLAWILVIAAGLCTIFMLLLTFLDSDAWIMFDDDDDNDDSDGTSQLESHVIEPRHPPHS